MADAKLSYCDCIVAVAVDEERGWIRLCGCHRRVAAGTCAPCLNGRHRDREGLMLPLNAATRGLIPLSLAMGVTDG
jgi:hypothetical protein